MAQATDDTTTNSNVIPFAPRQRTAPATAFVFEVPGAQRAVHSKSLFQLPFVTVPSEEVADWREFWKRTTMWNVQPTDDGSSDYHKGKKYAQDAIAAIIKDGAIPRNLEQVLRSMIESGFRRRGPTGQLCRRLGSAESGFIDELCKVAVEASRLIADPSLLGRA